MMVRELIFELLKVNLDNEVCIYESSTDSSNVRFNKKINIMLSKTEIGNVVLLSPIVLISLEKQNESKI